MVRVSRIIILCFLCTLLVSCHAKRTVVKEDKKQDVEGENRDTETIINKSHSFYTLKAKRMDIDFLFNGISEKVKGNMAIYRDSLIVISVIPILGYEAFRIICTADSVFVINRPEKTYHANSLDYYLKKYRIPVGFNGLLAALTNEGFYYRNDKAERSFTLPVFTDNENVMFGINYFKSGNLYATQRIIVNKTDLLIRNVSILDQLRNLQINLKYEEFSSQYGEYFPGRTGIDIIEKNNRIFLDINYGQVIFDEPINVVLKIPENYSRVDL